MIDLQSRDILQINATIIAGGLIFLTLVGNTVVAANNLTPLSLAVITMLITIMALSASSLSALLRRKDEALRLMATAFIIIILFVLAIFIMILIIGTPEPIRNFFSPTNQTSSNQSVIKQTIVNKVKIG